MLGELSSAFDWLSARSDVDSARIGVFGLSMGATFGYWLGAAETRIAAVMQLCCFADFAELLRSGAHDLHGIYLTVPGLLDLAGNGEIAGLVAPRPQLICIGDLDPLTPPASVVAIDPDKSIDSTTSSGFNWRVIWFDACTVMFSIWATARKVVGTTAVAASVNCVPSALGVIVGPVICAPM